VARNNFIKGRRNGVEERKRERVVEVDLVSAETRTSTQPRREPHSWCARIPRGRSTFPGPVTGPSPAGGGSAEPPIAAAPTQKNRIVRGSRAAREPRPPCSPRGPGGGVGGGFAPDASHASPSSRSRAAHAPRVSLPAVSRHSRARLHYKAVPAPLSLPPPPAPPPPPPTPPPQLSLSLSLSLSLTLARDTFYPLTLARILILIDSFISYSTAPLLRRPPPPSAALRRPPPPTATPGPVPWTGQAALQQTSSARRTAVIEQWFRASYSLFSLLLSADFYELFPSTAEYRRASSFRLLYWILTEDSDNGQGYLLGLLCAISAHDSNNNQLIDIRAVFLLRIY
jgi:hypothetical protein